MVSVWTDQHVAWITDLNHNAIPVITAQDIQTALPNLLLWDMWPIQLSNGHMADINNGSVWMVLAAPARSDPELRHFEARIRLLHLQNGHWNDLGWAMPESKHFFEREWSGTAVLKEGTVSLYFTAAGDRDNPGGYQQRLFETHGDLQADGRITAWSSLEESVANDGIFYEIADQQEGEPGKITAFRDPAYFCDPADGQEYLLFTASLAGATSAYNGAIGIARRTDGNGWTLLPPLLHADGVNKELERAHIVFKDGLYYLFWVTHASTFNPDGPIGPTGLYGMVAHHLFGDYEPVNNSGLVLANPPEEPTQGYSWFVTAELIVSSFVDYWGLNGRSHLNNPELAAQNFGGTPAPFVKLALDGNQARLLNETVHAS